MRPAQIVTTNILKDLGRFQAIEEIEIPFEMAITSRRYVQPRPHSLPPPAARSVDVKAVTKAEASTETTAAENQARIIPQAYRRDNHTNVSQATQSSEYTQDDHRQSRDKVHHEETSSKKETKDSNSPERAYEEPEHQSLDGTQKIPDTSYEEGKQAEHARQHEAKEDAEVEHAEAFIQEQE